jgi:hypothetical protein
MKLTVACVYVKGPYPFTAEYVVRLERMTRAYIRRPFEFVVLVDDKTHGETSSALRREKVGPDHRRNLVRIDSLSGVVPDNGAGYWNKLRLFDPTLEALQTGRILYLDLDVLVVQPLDVIIDFPADFALTTDALIKERAHLDRDRYGRRLVRRFNSSVMVWDAGRCAYLWRAWSPAAAQVYSTDQDWIGEKATAASGMPLEWFPRLGRLVKDAGFAANGFPMPPEARVMLTKKPKNHEARIRWRWFDQLWGGWTV